MTNPKIYCPSCGGREFVAVTVSLGNDTTIEFEEDGSFQVTDDATYGGIDIARGSNFHCMECQKDYAKKDLKTEKHYGGRK